MQNVEQPSPRQDSTGEELLPELLTANDIRTKMEQLIVDYGQESLQLNPSQDKLKDLVSQMEGLKDRLRELTPVEDKVYDYNDSAVKHISTDNLDDKGDAIDADGERERLTPEEAVARYNAAAVAHGEGAPELTEYAAVVDNSYESRPGGTGAEDIGDGVSIPVRRAPGTIGGVDLPGKWRAGLGSSESELTKQARALEESAQQWAEETKARRDAQRARAAERAARRAEKAASEPEVATETPLTPESDSGQEEVLTPPTAEELQELLNLVLEARKVVDEALEKYYAAKENSGANSSEADSAYNAYEKLRTAYDEHFKRYIEYFESARRQASDDYLRAVDEEGKDSERANELYELYLRAADQYSRMYKAAILTNGPEVVAEEPESSEVDVETPSEEELPDFLAGSQDRKPAEDIDPSELPDFLKPDGWTPPEQPTDTRPSEEDLTRNEEELARRRAAQQVTSESDFQKPDPNLVSWRPEDGMPDESFTPTAEQQ